MAKYTYGGTITAHTTAKSADVINEFQAVQAASATEEVRVNDAIKFPAGEGNDIRIIENAGQRANKVLFFNASGDLEVVSIGDANVIVDAGDLPITDAGGHYTGADVEAALQENGKDAVQTLTNKRLTLPKINEDVVVTATATELNLLDDATVTTAEINNIDGDTSATSTIVVGADRAVFNDNGVMKQVSMSDLKTFFTAGLNTKVIDIGDWNMNTTATATVAHGLTLSKIRSISVLIQNDAETEVQDFASVRVWTGESSNKSIQATGTNIVINRATGGSFDGTAYEDESPTIDTRGWITIQYTD